MAEKAHYTFSLTLSDVYTVHIKPVLIKKKRIGSLASWLVALSALAYKPLSYLESLGIHVRARARGNTPVSTLLHWDQLALKFQSCSTAVWT